MWLTVFFASRSLGNWTRAEYFGQEFFFGYLWSQQLQICLPCDLLIAEHIIVIRCLLDSGFFVFISQNYFSSLLNSLSFEIALIWFNSCTLIKGQQATKPPRNFTGSYFKMEIFAVSSKSKSCHLADPFPFVKLKIRNHFINYEWHNFNSNSWEIYRCYLWSNWCIMY